MLLEKLNQIKIKFTTVIDSRGGNELTKRLESLVEGTYKSNPYIDLITVDLQALGDIEAVENKVELYFNNGSNIKVNAKEIVGDYLKYKIEQQGLYCVYDRVNNKLKIKM